MSEVISATFFSSWDSYEKIFEAECKVDLKTGAVFDVGDSELLNLDQLNLENLDDEYVSYAGVNYAINNDGDTPFLIESSLAALRLSSVNNLPKQMKL